MCCIIKSRLNTKSKLLPEILCQTSKYDKLTMEKEYSKFQLLTRKEVRIHIVQFCNVPPIDV